jgi:hypothetical protein
MSWLFSRALVEAFSEATSSGGEPSAPSSGNPTQLAFLPPDRMTAFSRPSRSGMTFRPLTDGLGAAVLMWCQAASRARTSAWPAREQASTASDPACGDTWRGSLARFDPATSSWKTAQPSLLEDLGESSVIWPRSGMTADGQCWELPTLGHRISGTGSGLSVPTPTVYDSTGKGTPRKDSNLDQGGRHGVSLHHFVAKWPTPTSQGFDAGGADPRRSLYTAVRAMWPTPTTQDNPQIKGEGKATAHPKRGTTLGGAVRQWPTPNARDYKGAPGAGCQARGGHQSSLPSAVRMFHTPNTGGLDGGSNSRRAAEKRGETMPGGGSLNPTWVEWLMGWPLGWTDLKPLAMGKSPFAPQQPGDY